jgi:predicted 3-demethylubiquinone-9 3-methyltransferase (glyoxalase superfamily)
VKAMLFHQQKDFANYAHIPLGKYGASQKFAWIDDKYGVSWRLNWT